MDAGRNPLGDRVRLGAFPARRRGIVSALVVLLAGAGDLVGGGIARAGVDALAIDPTLPTTLYAGTTSPAAPLRPAPDMPPIGVYKSTDGAGTWSPTGLTEVEIASLAVDPTTPMTLYAGTWGAGLYKSIDAAGTWSQTALDGGYVVGLRIDPTTTPQTIYAYVQYPFGGGTFLATSTDGAATWTWSKAGAGGPGAPPVPAIAYVPMPGAGVYKTTDGGATWQLRSTGITDANVRVLAVDPATPTTLYAGTEGAGLFKSTDGACRWAAAGLSHTVGPAPAPPGCQAGPDGVGIARRLDQLASFIRALHPDGPSGLEQRLAVRANAARDRVTEAETLASTDERKAGTRLRRAVHTVLVLMRIDRPASHASAPFQLVFRLADGILVDLQALRRRGASEAVCR